jgi:hypothetical protein
LGSKAGNVVGNCEGGSYRKGKWTSWANFVKVKELKKGAESASLNFNLGKSKLDK